jgi:hypothetical protein
MAIVFTPDLSTPDNRSFYESLGFTYIESSDWSVVLQQLETAQKGVHPVGLVIIESHGANGHGLKLQSAHEPAAERSYISVGALQERLEPLGIRAAVISACNAGRLFRPEIYHQLNRKNRDPLFLPATCGVIDSRGTSKSGVQLLRRSRSELETIVEGSLEDFPGGERKTLRASIPIEGRFTISTMLMQLLLRDPNLQLTARGYVREKSRNDLSPAQSEEILRRFVSLVSELPPSF